jgi:hypothetical protein
LTKLEKATGSSRFDVNDTTVNDTISVSQNAINMDFILLSFDGMPCCFSKTYYEVFDDVSVSVLDTSVGWELLFQLRMINRVPQRTRTFRSKTGEPEGPSGFTGAEGGLESALNISPNIGW